MPKIKLPIYEGVSKAVDEVGLKTHGADMINVYVDELLNINRWPGYEEFADTGEASKVDGLHWWENQTKVIAQCNGKTFEITDSNGTIAEISGDTFEIGTRVKYADFGDTLYAANGGKILRTGSALSFDESTGSFTAGNVIYQMVNGEVVALATISQVEQSAGAGTLHLQGISGTFQDDYPIYEATYESELVTNGNFSAWTGDDPDNWIVNNEDGANYITEDSGKARFVSDGGQNLYMAQESILSIGEFFYYSSDIIDATSGNLQIYAGDFVVTMDSVQTYTGVFLATGTSFTVARGALSGDVTVDNVSVKKITNAALANGTLTDTAVVEILDEDAPTEVTHVAFIDKYLIANEVGTGNFHWSDVNAPSIWSGYYSEAEANPDRLVALDTQNLNLHLLGKKTLEKWYDDGSTPFVRLYQGLVQSGTVAVYSFAWCNAVQTFCWLDENRRVVMLESGAAVPLSLSINKYIQGFSTVSDAIGDYVEIVGRPFYILTFPSEEKVLAYDFISKNWYNLGSWNVSTGEYDLYMGNCYCLAPAWNLTLMGDRANGKIYKLSPTLYDEDGSILRSLIQTANYNHGAESNRKFCNGIYVRLKRTESVSEDGTPDLMIQYRDDGNTTWSTARSLTMHSIGNTEFLAYTTRLGSYYTRQWRFYVTDSYPLCIASVDEDVDIEND